MLALQEEIYTVEDIYALPPGERAELIDGVLYDMAPPGTRHQKFSMKLSSMINSYIEEKKGRCEVYAAPFAVFLNEDEINYVEPDISVICDTKKLDEKGCHGAPDLIIEIVSPSSRKMDYIIKQFKYCQSGVREYWIVDSDKRSVMVYHYEEDAAPEFYSFTDRIKVQIFEDLYIDFRQLD